MLWATIIFQLRCSEHVNACEKPFHMSDLEAGDTVIYAESLVCFQNAVAKIYSLKIDLQISQTTWSMSIQVATKWTW